MLPSSRVAWAALAGITSLESCCLCHRRTITFLTVFCTVFLHDHQRLIIIAHDRPRRRHPRRLALLAPSVFFWPVPSTTKLLHSQSFLSDNLTKECWCRRSAWPSNRRQSSLSCCCLCSSAGPRTVTYWPTASSHSLAPLLNLGSIRMGDPGWAHSLKLSSPLAVSFPLLAAFLKVLRHSFWEFPWFLLLNQPFYRFSVIIHYFVF